MASHWVFSVALVSFTSVVFGSRVNAGDLAAKLLSEPEGREELKGNAALSAFAQNLTGSQISQVVHDLSNGAESAVESLEWLNSILKHIWPQTNEAINEIVRDTVNPQLAASLPSALQNLQIQPFTLSSSPTVGPVKVYASTTGIKLKLGIHFKSDEHISIEGALVSAGIEHFSMDGDLVIHLAPIIGSSPVVGGARVYFVHPPRFRFKCSGLAEIADVPGAAGYIRRAVNSVIASKLVLPNCMGIPLASAEQGVNPVIFDQPEAIGLIRITVLGAAGLPNLDWNLIGKIKSDPYVTIETADASWSTATISNNLDPKWTEGNLRDFVVYDKEQAIQLTVYDEDMMNQDDMLGETGLVTYASVANSKGPMQLELRGPDGGAAGSLVARFEPLLFDGCGASSNGVVFLVRVQKIVMPATVATTAAAVFTINGASKSSVTGRMPVPGTAMLQDVVERMHASSVPVAQMAKFTGMTEAQVNGIVEHLEAESGDYAGAVHLHIGSKLYFLNPVVDLMTPEPMTVQIVDEGGNQLAEGSVDISEMDLLMGMGTKEGCVSGTRSLLLRHASGANILVRFDVSMYTFA